MSGKAAAITRIACAQMNATVGDIEGNKEKIRFCIERAHAHAADIVVFPELSLTGYPPEDLLLKPSFIADNLTALGQLAAAVPDIIAVVGCVDKAGGRIFNAAAILYRGAVAGIYHKKLLPNYGVFDEKRYFTPGQRPGVFAYAHHMFGVTICEDIWLAGGPLDEQARLGAGCILNLSASPYHMGKQKIREQTVCRQARHYGLPIVYTNLIGGQDELVFDGQSMMIDGRGKVVVRLPAFREDMLFADLQLKPAGNRKSKAALNLGCPRGSRNKPVLIRRDAESLEPVAEVYRALAVGLRDYVVKNGFKKVVLGLSGGIDSALVACLAVDALGQDNVTGVFMPSRYSSQESLTDAQMLAENLHIEFQQISIEHIYKMYLLVLEPHFTGRGKDVTEENLQARIRGNILMALSNKFGWLVLTTGNKSEMSTGYATLYGDMAGGLAVIKDVPKTLVYRLCAFRNSLHAAIPQRIFTKPPTAELRPNQKDSDSLPDYALLDPILKEYIENDRSSRDIAGKGYAQAIVEKVVRLVDRTEYNRRQAPPGIKITPKAFGRDRRMPVTNRYSDTGSTGA